MATVQEIKDELANGGYSTDPVIATNQLRDSGILTQSTAESDHVLSFAGKIGLIPSLYAISESLTHPLRSSSQTALIALQSARPFNLDNADIQTMLTAYTMHDIDGALISDSLNPPVLSESNRLGIMALGQFETFKNVKIADVMKAMDIDNSFVITNKQWKAGGAIKLNVLGVVNEPFKPIITRTNSFETATVMRRSMTISKSGGHYIDLGGLISPDPVNQHTLTVHLNAPNPFTAELI